MAHVTPQPSDSLNRPGWRWFPLNVGTALAVAVIFGLLTFMLTSNGESVAVAGDEAESPITGENPGEVVALAEPAPAASRDDIAIDRDGVAVAEVDELADLAAPPTTVAAAGLESLGGGDAALATHGGIAAANEITNMGPTEVGFVNNFPSVDYTWQRIEIATDGQFDVGWLGEFGGKLVAVSPSWDGGSEMAAQSLVTNVSEDGLSWETAGRYQLPEDAWVSRVISDGERIYAVAERWVSETGDNEQFVLSSSDGVAWTTSQLDLNAEPDEHVYIQNAAAGPAGIALAVSFETYPEEPPMLLDFEPLQVKLDHANGLYSLIDMSSGEALVSGPTDELFNWNSDGQAIYDPVTGELLTTIPWETWERSYNLFYGDGYGGGSPLPIPIYPQGPSETPVITIEYDGLVVTVDEYAALYTVADAETGEEIASGPMDYLYQGPPPRIVDPDSGEVLLSVTWDEWYKAEERSYANVDYEGDYYDYRTRTALVTSVGGETWDIETISTRSGGSVSYLVATEMGFVAMINSYGEYGEYGSVWTMEDGAWSSVDAERSDLWLYQVATTSNGLIGVGEGAGGPALWSSRDGVSWASEFAIVAQNDGSYVSLTDVAASDTGTVGVLAYREKWSEYQPLVIEADGYTIAFEDGETMLRVTDTTSGETVLALGWGAFEEEGGSDTVTWVDGVTYIDLGNGDVIDIADDEAYAATEGRYTDQGKLGLSVFLSDGSGWAEAMVEVDGGLSGASQLYLVDDKIVIGGSYWEGEPYYSAEPVQSSFVVIVGTPVGR